MTEKKKIWQKKRRRKLRQRRKKKRKKNLENLKNYFKCKQSDSYLKQKRKFQNNVSLDSLISLIIRNNN